MTRATCYNFRPGVKVRKAKPIAGGRRMSDPPARRWSPHRSLDAAKPRGAKIRGNSETSGKGSRPYLRSNGASTPRGNLIRRG